MKDMKPVAWLCESDDGENVYAAVNEFQMKEFERFGRKITPLYAIPDGYVVVPVEPTQMMVGALKENLATNPRGEIIRAGVALTEAIKAAQEESDGC